MQSSQSGSYFEALSSSSLVSFYSYAEPMYIGTVIDKSLVFVTNNAIRGLVNSAGNFGINTTAPTHELNVVGDTNITDDLFVGGQIFVPSGGAGVPSYTFSTDTDIGMYKAGTNILGFSTAGTRRIVIDATGNVGIGTIAPTHELNVVGDGNFTDDLFVGDNIAIGTTTPQADFHFVGANGIFLIGDNEADSTTKAMRLGSQHYNNSEEPFLLWLSTSTATDNILNIGGSTALGNAATELRFFTGDNNTHPVGTQKMVIASDGNVSISAGVSPADKLVIGSGGILMPTGEASGIYHANAGYRFGSSGVDVDMYANSNAKIDIDANANSGVKFFAITHDGGTELMRVQEDGNVGIGTTAPTQKLDVNGSINQTNGNFTGNQIYGEMWFHNDTNPNVTVLTQNVWGNVTALNGQDSNGVSLNGFSKNPSDIFIEPQIPGIYMAVYHITGTGTANNVYHGAVAINDVIQLNTEGHDRVSTGNDVMDLSGNGILQLSVGDKVTLQILNADSGGDFNINAAGINLVRLGN